MKTKAAKGVSAKGVRLWILGLACPVVPGRSRIASALGMARPFFTT